MTHRLHDSKAHTAAQNISMISVGEASFLYTQAQGLLTETACYVLQILDFC